MTLRCWGGFLRLKKLKEAWGSGNPSPSWNSSPTKQITAFGIGLWRWTSQVWHLNIFSSLGHSYLTTERQSAGATILEASVFSTCYFSRVQRAAKASTWFRHLWCQAEDWLRKSVEAWNKLSQAILDIPNIMILARQSLYPHFSLMSWEMQVFIQGIFKDGSSIMMKMKLCLGLVWYFHSNAYCKASLPNFEWIQIDIKHIKIWTFTVMFSRLDSSALATLFNDWWA